MEPLSLQNFTHPQKRNFLFFGVWGSWGGSWGLGIHFRHFRSENGRFRVREAFERLRIAILIDLVVPMTQHLRSGPVSGSFSIKFRAHLRARPAGPEKEKRTREILQVLLNALLLTV